MAEKIETTIKEVPIGVVTEKTTQIGKAAGYAGKETTLTDVSGSSQQKREEFRSSGQTSNLSKDAGAELGMGRTTEEKNLKSK